MENKNVPAKADEKTKVIAVNQPAHNQHPSLKPGAAAVSSVNSKQATPTLSSYFKRENTSAKRTIVAGAISGGLLLSFLALTSFNKKSAEESSGGDADGISGNQNEISDGEVVTINTGHEVYTGLHDDLALEDARAIARENTGADGLFIYNNELHPVRTDEEWNSLTEDQKLDYIDGINVMPPRETDVVTLPVDVNGTVMDLKMDPLHLGDMWQLGYDDAGTIYFVPQGRPAITLKNVSRGEDGTYYRNDPVTGEMKVFTVEEIMQKIDQHGSVDMEVLVPGFEEPLIDIVIPTYTDDTNTDTNVELKSDYDVAREIAAQIAHEKGIDDIKKIKVHQNKDGTWDYKAKGDNGEKVKGTITSQEIEEYKAEETVAGVLVEEPFSDTGEQISILSHTENSITDHTNSLATQGENVQTDGFDDQGNSFSNFPGNNPHNRTDLTDF